MFIEHYCRVLPSYFNSRLKELQLDTDAYVAQYVNQSEKYAVRQRHWRLRTEEAIRSYEKVGAKYRVLMKTNMGSKKG